MTRNAAEQCKNALETMKWSYLHLSVEKSKFLMETILLSLILNTALYFLMHKGIVLST